MPDILTRADARYYCFHCFYREHDKCLGSSCPCPICQGRENSLPEPKNALERNSGSSSPIPADSAEFSPHPFVGIPAGELGMSTCEQCGLPERDVTHSLKFQPAPETIRISLPALRAIVLTLIDDGWQCSKGCDLRHPWAFPTEMFNGDRHPSDEDIGQREKFCDLLADRLRQLPARGWREK